MDRLWWNHITKAHKFLEDIISSALDGKSMILCLPENVPWRDTLLELVEDRLKLENPKNALQIMQQAEEACEASNLQILGGHTEVTRVVSQPLVSVTGVGKAKAGHLITTGGARPGMDILVTKWIGIEGTSIIAKEKKEELCSHFPRQLVETAAGLDQYLSVLPEAAVAVKSGVAAMHDVTEGGIFGALWEMAEASGVGLDIDLKKIPIRQETVEICEYFDINPYELISSGCMLMAAPDGNGLVMALERAGIPATVIGKATEGNDRIIRNGEEKRFLEPPKTDQLYQVM